MFTSSRKDKSVSVEKVDGGWILDWRDESRAPSDRNRYSAIRQLPEPATSGREIFTNKKKLIERIGEFL